MNAYEQHAMMKEGYHLNVLLGEAFFCLILVLLRVVCLLGERYDRFLGVLQHGLEFGHLESQI